MQLSNALIESLPWRVTHEDAFHRIKDKEGCLVLTLDSPNGAGSLANWIVHEINKLNGTESVKIPKGLTQSEKVLLIELVGGAWRTGYIDLFPSERVVAMSLEEKGLLSYVSDSVRLTKVGAKVAQALKEYGDG